MRILNTILGAALISLASAITVASAEISDPDAEQISLISEKLSLHSPEEELTISDLVTSSAPVEGGGELVSACGNVQSASGKGKFPQPALFMGNFLTVPDNVLPGVAGGTDFIIIGIAGQHGVTHEMVSKACRSNLGLHY